MVTECHAPGSAAFDLGEGSPSRGGTAVRGFHADPRGWAQAPPGGRPFLGAYNWPVSASSRTEVGVAPSRAPASVQAFGSAALLDASPPEPWRGLGKILSPDEAYVPLLRRTACRWKRVRATGIRLEQGFLMIGVYRDAKGATLSVGLSISDRPIENPWDAAAATDEISGFKASLIRGTHGEDELRLLVSPRSLLRITARRGTDLLAALSDLDVQGMACGIGQARFGANSVADPAGPSPKITGPAKSWLTPIEHEFLMAFGAEVEIDGKEIRRPQDDRRASAILRRPPPGCRDPDSRVVEGIESFVAERAALSGDQTEDAAKRAAIEEKVDTELARKAAAGAFDFFVNGHIVEGTVNETLGGDGPGPASAFEATKSVVNGVSKDGGLADLWALDSSLIERRLVAQARYLAALKVITDHFWRVGKASGSILPLTLGVDRNEVRLIGTVGPSPLAQPVIRVTLHKTSTIGNARMTNKGLGWLGSLTGIGPQDVATVGERNRLTLNQSRMMDLSHEIVMVLPDLDAGSRVNLPLGKIPNSRIDFVEVKIWSSAGSSEIGLRPTGNSRCVLGWNNPVFASACLENRVASLSGPAVPSSGSRVAWTVALLGDAPPEGAIVDLKSSNPIAVVVPAKIAIPPWGRSATFDMAIVDPLATTTILASWGLIDYPAVGMTGYAIARHEITSRIESGTGAAAMITLNGNAPKGGLKIVLESSDTNVATCPTSVTVPARSSTVRYTVTVLRKGYAAVRARIGPKWSGDNGVPIPVEE